MGERLVTLFECFLNFPGASYLDIQCMRSGRISQCYININSNAFTAKTSRGCNGLPVRNHPKGKIGCKTKTRNPEKF